MEKQCYREKKTEEKELKEANKIDSSWNKEVIALTLNPLNLTVTLKADFMIILVIKDECVSIDGTTYERITHLVLEKKLNASEVRSKAPMYFSRHAINIPQRERPFEQCTTAIWSLRISSQLFML
jgi:hypothetical protein